jgi:hypothetical protein
MLEAVHCLIWKTQNLTDSMEAGGHGLKVTKRKMTEEAGRRNWMRKDVMVGVHVKSSANCWKCLAMQMQVVVVVVSTAAADVIVNDESSWGACCMQRRGQD